MDLVTIAKYLVIQSYGAFSSGYTEGTRLPYLALGGNSSPSAPLIPGRRVRYDSKVAREPVSMVPVRIDML